MIVLKTVLKIYINIAPTCFGAVTPSSGSALSVLATSYTLAATDNELPEGGVTASKHVGATLM